MNQEKTLSINHINGEVNRDRRTLSSRQLEKLEKALNDNKPMGEGGTGEQGGEFKRHRFSEASLGLRSYLLAKGLLNNNR